jgi:ParB family chromosome partitioning protein
MKRGLGKGLSALIPQRELPAEENAVLEIEIDRIIPNPRQPRQVFNEDHLKELAESIQTQGVAQPILVRPRNGNYELIAGERRWRASKLAGQKTIPAIVNDLSDEQSLEIALVENLQREDLNPIDEARAYKQLSLEFNFTQDHIAQRVSKDRSTVANTMRLLDLPAEIQELILNNQLNTGQARPLLSLGSPQEQLNLCKIIIKKGLNAREVERIVSENGKTKKQKNLKNSLALELQDIQEKLTTHLGTKVTVRGSAKNGKIEIEYFSREDLERLAENILRD